VEIIYLINSFFKNIKHDVASISDQEKLILRNFPIYIRKKINYKLQLENDVKYTIKIKIMCKYCACVEICKNMFLCMKYAKYAVTYKAKCIISYETNLYFLL